MCRRDSKDMTAVWFAVLFLLFAGAASEADSRELGEGPGPAEPAAIAHLQVQPDGPHGLIGRLGYAAAGAAGECAERAWVYGAGALGLTLE